MHTLHPYDTLFRSPQKGGPSFDDDDWGHHHEEQGTFFPFVFG